MIQPQHGRGGEEGLRICSHGEDYDTPEDQKLALEQSLSCVYQIRDFAGYTHQVFSQLTAQIEEICEIQVSHEPFKGVTAEGEETV